MASQSFLPTTFDQPDLQDRLDIWAKGKRDYSRVDNVSLPKAHVISLGHKAGEKGLKRRPSVTTLNVNRSSMNFGVQLTTPDLRTSRRISRDHSRIDDLRFSKKTTSSDIEDCVFREPHTPPNTPASETEVKIHPSGIPNVEGQYHSIESFSAVDGPGIRFVIFLQGCKRRCKFCSNPDTWATNKSAGKTITTKELRNKLERCVSFLKPHGGGITCSGGEPLMQTEFVTALFQEAHDLGITTALDTTGWGTYVEWSMVLPHTDLVMLSPKSFDRQKYMDLTSNRIDNMLHFLKEVEQRKTRLWIRWVLITGWTDSQKEIQSLSELRQNNPFFEAVDLLPYHRLGVEKWRQMKKRYPFDGVSPPTKQEIRHFKDMLMEKGIHVNV